MTEDVLKRFKQTNVINNNNTSSPKDFSSFTGTLKDSDAPLGCCTLVIVTLSQLWPIILPVKRIICDLRQLDYKMMKGV